MEKKNRRPDASEAPIPAGIYPELDNDLARDNIENDLPVADLSELRPGTQKRR